MKKKNKNQDNQIEVTTKDAEITEKIDEQTMETEASQIETEDEEKPRKVKLSEKILLKMLDYVRREKKPKRRGKKQEEVEPLEAMKPIKRFAVKINENPIVANVVISIVATLIIEILSRRSFVEAFKYMVSSPLIFLIDVLIIFASLSIALLFKKRLFVIALVTIVWLGMGTVNYCLLSYRTTPFSAVDIKLLKSVGSIMSMYLSKTETILIVVVGLLLVVATGLLWVKIPKMRGKINYSLSLAIVVVSVLVTVGINRLEVNLGLIDLDLGNIAYTYDQCGFAYCFVNSVVNVGIDKPYNYNEDTMVGLKEEIEGLDKRADTERPNVIFVQLESFYDVNRMANYSYSENPVPNWEKLKKDYASGYLTVPSIGAGTANTEFEVISGMSLDYFGFCEYPYKTILKNSNCESICYNLSELGYTSTAIHDNKGNFYSRNKVFPRLGFDNFISLEYMDNVEYNPLGWAKDECLIDQITGTLESTDNQDFIYTITVQPHGKYPDTQVDPDRAITMTGEDDPIVKNQYEYYVNQVYEEDKFVKELTDTLSDYDEDVVLVMYGDHLPTFEMSEDYLESGSLYQTEYVIWSNFGLDAKDQDLNTFQLGAIVMGDLNFDNGVLTKLHQNMKDDDDYQEKLVLMQFDMLYGDKYVYDGNMPYSKTKLHMGMIGKEQTMKLASNQCGHVYVYGSNFNEWSYVFINGTKQETELYKEGTLIVRDTQLEPGDRVVVKQLAGGTSSVSKTEEYIYN